MAITVEFGKCAQCDENNPKQLQTCRKCNAPLPWAKASKPKIVKAAPAPRAVARPVVNNYQSGTDWGFWGVALISFIIPIVGLVLYFSYSRNGDEKATAAIGGFLVAILFIIVRVALRFATS